MLDVYNYKCILNNETEGNHSQKDLMNTPKSISNKIVYLATKHPLAL